VLPVDAPVPKVVPEAVLVADDALPVEVPDVPLADATEDAEALPPTEAETEADDEAVAEVLLSVPVV
jgi:hypothetical protein